MVTITPDASCGPITACCIGDPVIAMGNVCPGATECTFTVTQQLCLTIPVTFNAEGECIPTRRRRTFARRFITRRRCA